MPKQADSPAWLWRYPRGLVKMGRNATVDLPLYAGVRRHIEGEWMHAVRSTTLSFEHYNHFVGIADGGKRARVQF